MRMHTTSRHANVIDPLSRGYPPLKNAMLCPGKQLILSTFVLGLNAMDGHPCFSLMLFKTMV
jgi:hypothetical protein